METYIGRQRSILCCDFAADDDSLGITGCLDGKIRTHSFGASVQTKRWTSFLLDMTAVCLARLEFEQTLLVQVGGTRSFALDVRSTGA